MNAPTLEEIHRLQNIATQNNDSCSYWALSAAASIKCGDAEAVSQDMAYLIIRIARKRKITEEDIITEMQKYIMEARAWQGKSS